MIKCAILTIGYNAEKTIARTIESVLAQTGAEIVYYLVDNGSTDSTNEICCRYAQQDDRIVFFQEKSNWICSIEYINRILAGQPEAEYFCTVDADDALTPEFLCSAVAAMEKHYADLVVLGTELIDAETGEVAIRHIMPSEVVVSSKNFGDMFPKIHWYLRQLWCKLYRVSVLRSYELFIDRSFIYGGDTALILQFLHYADKVVFVPVYGYHYSLSKGSMSYRFAAERYHSDELLFEMPLELLEQKVGYVSEQNRDFLLQVYYHAMVGTLNVALQADITAQERLAEIYGSYSSAITQELFSKDSNFVQPEDWKERMHEAVTSYLIADAGAYVQDDMKQLAAIFSQMNQEFPRMIAEENLLWLLAHAPSVVASTALHYYEEAFSELWAALERGQLPCCEVTLVLGQALCGALSRVQEYEMFSRLLIEWCIENGQRERADRELSDWLLMRPNDPELLELKARL